MTQSIVFFGTDAISAPTLQALIDNDWVIDAVITKPDRPRGRSSQPTSPIVKTIALENNIPVLQPHKLSELTEVNKPFNTSTAVLVSYGKIVPKIVIDLFPTGIINVHPSLLPKYRGPTPFQTAILNGDWVTGVSLMRLVEEMDAGPVYVQKEHRLDGTKTADVLGQQLATVGAQLLIDNLPGIIDGSLAPTSQDDSQATYCSLFTKAQGQVDWNKSAGHLEREIRAYYEWPKSTATLGAQTFIIKKAHVIEDTGQPGSWKIDGNQLIVYTAKDALVLDEVQPIGKKPMSVAAFLAGNRL